MPKFWEDRTAMFCTFLIDNGAQSATLKSYISAIKSVLVDEKYPWDDDKAILSSLTKACKQTNDIVTSLPIHCRLLEVLLLRQKEFFCNNHIFNFYIRQYS